MQISLFLITKIVVFRNFTYEGKAPDAFLIAGINSPEPNDKPEVVFPFPFEVSSQYCKNDSKCIDDMVFRASIWSTETDK